MHNERQTYLWAISRLDSFFPSLSQMKISTTKINLDLIQVDVDLNCNLSSPVSDLTWHMHDTTTPTYQHSRTFTVHV